jgi:hypothetical protein
VIQGESGRVGGRPVSAAMVFMGGSPRVEGCYLARRSSGTEALVTRRRQPDSAPSLILCERNHDTSLRMSSSSIR